MILLDNQQYDECYVNIFIEDYVKVYYKLVCEDVMFFVYFNMFFVIFIIYFVCFYIFQVLEYFNEE